MDDTQVGQIALENAMWLSAFCSLHHDRSRDHYARKRSEGKQHNAAIVCLACRRCDVIHALLRQPQLRVGRRRSRTTCWNGSPRA